VYDVLTYWLYNIIIKYDGQGIILPENCVCACARQQVGICVVDIYTHYNIQYTRTHNLACEREGKRSSAARAPSPPRYRGCDEGGGVGGGWRRRWRRVYIRTCVCHWPLLLRLAVGGVCARVSGSHAIPSSLTAARTSAAAVDCFCASGLVVDGGRGCGRWEDGRQQRNGTGDDPIGCTPTLHSSRSRVSTPSAHCSSFHSRLHVN